jgi:hypothetical protein
VHELRGIWSIAGLSGSSAMVSVGPPLQARPSKPISATLLWLVVLVKPHDLSSLRSLRNEAILRAGCYCHRKGDRARTPFLRTLLGNAAGSTWRGTTPMAAALHGSHIRYGQNPCGGSFENQTPYSHPGVEPFESGRVMVSRLDCEDEQ